MHYTNIAQFKAFSPPKCSNFCNVRQSHRSIRENDVHLRVLENLRSARYHEPRRMVSTFSRNSAVVYQLLFASSPQISKEGLALAARLFGVDVHHCQPGGGLQWQESFGGKGTEKAWLPFGRLAQETVAGA